MSATRVEQDSMGEIAVPVEAYYGAQTQRASRNFEISELRFPRAFLRALGLVKRVAAAVNTRDSSLISPDLAAAIGRAARRRRGRHDDQFILDIFQDRQRHLDEHECQRGDHEASPTRALTASGGPLSVHPNDDEPGPVLQRRDPDGPAPGRLGQLREHLLPALSGSEPPWPIALGPRRAREDRPDPPPGRGADRLGRNSQATPRGSSTPRNGVNRSLRVAGGAAHQGTAAPLGSSTHQEFPIGWPRPSAGRPAWRSARRPMPSSMAQRDAAVETSVSCGR
ncbi:MAG: hypothetical protein U0790_24145 [Isosphaeraceae bacterium]